MKAQICSLINGSENTIRNASAEKYLNNPIGFYSGKDNVPASGGTPYAERMAIAETVNAENPAELLINVRGITLALVRSNSLSGKSWHWETEITPAQYETVTGEDAPAWTHKSSENHYGIVINGDCTVEVYATSGKKSVNRILGEEFVKIL